MSRTNNLASVKDSTFLSVSKTLLDLLSQCILVNDIPEINCYLDTREEENNMY